MKKNNKDSIRVFNIFNALIVGLILINIILFSNILLEKYHLVPPYYLTIFIIFLIWITSAHGNQFYSIETKGETITFETKKIDILSIFNANRKIIDVPKYKLNNYHYKRGILSRKIIIFIKSNKSGNLVKINFKLSFISNKSIKNILKELDKIVKKNKLEHE